MSASSKKKLRKEQEAAAMTEKQLAAQKEAKKTKLYTTVFVVVMVAILAIAVIFGSKMAIENSGIREKNTTALTVGEQELNSVEMNYFFMDAVNQFYNNYGSYASMFGLDVTKPLDEQFVDEEAGTTWADDFMTSAKEAAASTYALAEAAKEAGFTLSDEEQLELDVSLGNLSYYAAMYGYSDADSYLRAMYGNGASEESYREYCELQALASAYYTHYSESLTYSEEDLRAAEAGKEIEYNGYSYNTYYLSTSRFLTGGTTAEDGTTTYSDEEKAAAEKAAEEAAKALTGADIKTVADLDAAIANLEINKDSDVSSTHYENTLYTGLTEAYREWITASGRVSGDIAYFPSVSGDTVNGFHVVMFQESGDNDFAMKNVRHILIAPEHNHEEGEEHAEDETYSAEELAAAKAEAEEILAAWKAGEATEEAFAALANEKSADGDGTTGGLYENIYPGQMVDAFEAWCFDESRKTGDTGIVETEYGYHVMYFVGDAELSYRDHLIQSELRSNDLSTWYAETVEAMATTDGDTKYVRTDLVLNANA